MRAAVVRAFPIGAIALLLLLSASPASACNCPTLMVVGPMGAAAPHVAGPGDRVSYSLTQLTVGAKWAIIVDGTAIASGEASGYEVRGTFVVPELGDSSRSVGVEARVIHDDFNQEGCNTRPADYLEYTVPKPPPSDPSRAGAPQEDGQAGRGEPPRRAQRPPQPDRPAGKRAEHPASTSPPLAPAAPVTHPGPAHLTSTQHGTEQVVAAASSAAQVDAVANAPDAARRVRTASPNGPGAAVPFRRELRATHAVRRQPRAEPAREGIPSGAVVALGVLLLAGMAGGGWALIRGRRGGPEPDPDAATLAPVRPGGAAADLDAELGRLLAGELEPIDVGAELQEIPAAKSGAADAAHPRAPAGHR